MALCWVTHMFMASERWHLPGPFLRDLLICLRSSLTALLPGLQSHPCGCPEPPSPPPRASSRSRPLRVGTHGRLHPPGQEQHSLVPPGRPQLSTWHQAPRCSGQKAWCCARPLPPPTADPSASPAGSLSRIQPLLSCPNPQPRLPSPLAQNVGLPASLLVLLALLPTPWLLCHYRLLHQSISPRKKGLGVPSVWETLPHSAYGRSDGVNES